MDKNEQILIDVWVAAEAYFENQDNDKLMIWRDFGILLENAHDIDLGKVKAGERFHKILNYGLDEWGDNLSRWDGYEVDKNLFTHSSITDLRSSIESLTEPERLLLDCIIYVES